MSTPKPGAVVAPTRQWVEAVRRHVNRIPTRGVVERVEEGLSGPVLLVKWDGAERPSPIAADDVYEPLDT